MCDTIVVTARATADGSVLFAKNSDREPNEAQALEIVPAAEHPAGARVSTTYLSIPEVQKTRAMLICRPFWMWGAEMGVNDAGVAIGNEAVFTRVRPGAPALLGMDLLRLTLARAGSARRAVDVLGALLEEFGQGGPAGLAGGFPYDSAFLLADHESAWVLETAGTAWVAARVEGIRAISNALSLRDDWELGADGLAARARDAGLSPGKGKIDFARTFGRPTMSFAAHARARRRSNETVCAAARGRLGPLDLMRALRRHGPRDDVHASLRSPFMTVCAHASWWPTRQHGQTTGSLVSWIGRDAIASFATATSAPCVSSFKPIFLDAGLPATTAAALRPGARYDPSQTWWRHERLHRAALSDLPEFLARFAPERDRLEAQWVREALAGSTDRAALSLRAFVAADDLARRFERAQRVALRGSHGLLRRYWKRLDTEARLPGS